MIDIDRFQLAIRADTVRERVPLIEARLRDVVRGPLVRTLHTLGAPALAAGTDKHDTALVFIDSLTLRLAVNTTWSDDTLAQHLARGVAAALAHAGQEPLPGVRRFDDRADWLAQYLVARMGANAASAWWFDDLDGLRMLPLSAALRTVLCTQGEDGLAAAARLGAPGLAQLVLSLGELEQARVLQTWLTRPGAVATPVAQLLAAAAQTHAASHAECLRAAVTLERGTPGAINARSLRVLAGLSALVHSGQALVPSMFEGLADELPQACQRAGVDSAWLVELNAEERSELARALCASVPGPSGSARPRAQEPTADDAISAGHAASFSARTRWGGVFVLASVMHWRRWPVRCSTPWQCRRCSARLTTTTTTAVRPCSSAR